MSYWTYITGVIDVLPMGRSQPEKRYILDTVLEHLPIVTGSEDDMHIKVIQKDGYDSSSTCNEFGEWIPGKLYKTQDHYQLVIYGSFRDRVFDETLREFNKWINRLAKRVWVKDVLVKITDYDKKLIISNPEPYRDMEESPSWLSDDGLGEPCWAEYLMWDMAKNSSYPMKLARKYYDDPENDTEVERRVRYERGED